MTDKENGQIGRFEDPLENYDAPTFDDPLEQALHDGAIADIQAQPMTCVDAETSVRETMKLMVGLQIACVLVRENERLVGVFSDRDVLDKVSLEYDDVIDGPVRAVMSTDPVYVTSEDCAAKALTVMAVSGYRHVPVVNSKNEPVGIVSPQRMCRFLMSHMKS